MKTALLISGMFRGSDDYENIRQQIIEPYEADVFLDIWTPEHPHSIDQIHDSYRPVAMTMEQYQPLPNLPEHVFKASGVVARESKVSNVFAMFHRVYQCNELRKRYEQTHNIQYERVIRFRFELTFSSFPVITPEPNTCHIPQGSDYGGVNDMVAISDAQTMDRYCSTYLKLREYQAARLPTHPESVVKSHLEREGVVVKRFQVKGNLRGRPWWS